MPKRLKLKFPSITIPSFHICRPRNPTSFPKNPKPTANYRRSPVDARAVDISFPTATPEYTYVSRRASSVRKIRSSSDGREFPRRTVEMTTSKKYFVKEKKKKKKKSSAARASHMYTLTGSDQENDKDNDDDDSLVLLDSSRSFSGERFPTAAICRRRPDRTSEGVAVVKKSTNPYEDFKRSMLEMIMEKEMFDAMDLEELLQCFLSLNSRQYHGIIVEAFSEIWDTLFSDSSIAQHRLSF